MVFDGLIQIRGENYRRNYIWIGQKSFLPISERGTDDILVPVPNGELCKEAYIGRAVMDADIIISLGSNQ